MNFFNIDSQVVLDRISRHCPRALSIYLQCVNRADNEGTFFFTRNIVEIEMSEEWSQFKKSIKKLALENVLEWHPFNDGISITLAAIDEDE